MTSCDKSLNKNKYIFKTDNNNLLTPLYDNHLRKLNIYPNIKNEQKGKFPEIAPKFSKLPVTQNKQNINNSQAIYNITEISKTYSLSKPKNENNRVLNSKYKLSKVVSNDFSARIKNSKILDIYNNKNTFNQMNSFKIESNSTFDNLNKNKFKLTNNSNIINNNSINDLRNLNLNIKKNSKEFTTNDSYNNNLFNENSTNNSNLATKRETIGNQYMKTDINDIYLNTPKEINYEKRIIIDSKNKNLMGTPDALLRKNNKIILSNTTPENKIKISIEKNNKNISKDLKIKSKNNQNTNNINTIKQNKNEHIILESISNSNGYNSKTIKNKYTIDSNNFDKEVLKQNKKIKIYKMPEELHFYYISSIQDGKKNEIELEGE